MNTNHTYLLKKKKTIISFKNKDLYYVTQLSNTRWPYIHKIPFTTNTSMNERGRNVRNYIREQGRLGLENRERALVYDSEVRITTVCLL